MGTTRTASGRRRSPPPAAQAHLALAAMLQAQGNLPGAEINLRRALAHGDDPAVFDRLVAVLEAQGKAQEAIAAGFTLGNRWYARGQMEAAAAAFRRVLRLAPTLAPAHYNLANALRAQGRLADAEECFRQAVLHQPGFAPAHNNLGNLLLDLARPEEAVACFERALALDPAYAQAYYNLGNARVEQNRHEEAIACYQRALALRPDDAFAHYNLALARLRLGDFERGWAEYEWRWRRPDFPPLDPSFTQPPWRGEALAGRAILLHAEQGFGDTLQFARYGPLMARRGARVVLACPPELVRLLRSLAGVASVVPVGAPLPADLALRAPLMSLPHLLGTTLATIPAGAPYLSADRGLAARWAPRLPAACVLRVGLAWTGRSSHPRNRARSLPLAALGPLARVPGIALVALQAGPAASQAAPGIAAASLGPLLGDFADTAAVVSQLDLVITVDTALAHLAGALGKPVWILLSYVPDWRWLLDREDSPWYPTARLFRQPRPGDWETVVARVVAALGEFTAHRR